MGQDDRPEDEREPTGGTEPEVEASEEEADVLAVLSAGEATAPEPSATPDGEARQSETEGFKTSTRDGPPRHRVLRVLAIVGGALAVGLFLVGWNRVATTDDFCASCHEVEPAVASAQRSVHDDVPCLSCHTGSGLLGALRYLPTLARETVDEFTGWDVAHGVLEARPCESCHDDIAATPELAAAHEEGARCLSCHGDVAHPPYRLAGFTRPVESVPSGENPHPTLYVQMHGDDVVRDPDSCTDCHETDYCETCHFRETYPHPDDWITQHGTVQADRGVEACEGCHPVTFCAGCHGTQIPHASTWLAEHWRGLQDASAAPCFLCHTKTDCTRCHAQHSVHTEQDLYA